MYCRHCGKDMGNPGKFCPFCGKATGFVSDESSLDVSRSTSAVDVNDYVGKAGGIASKKSHRIVAVVAAFMGVLLLSGLGFFVLGDDDKVAEVSMVTRILPEDDSGEPLTDYAVELKSGGGQAYRLLVSDAEGFALEDLGESVPAGSYQMTILAENGQIYGSWRMNLVSEGEKSENEWRPSPGSDGEAGDSSSSSDAQSKSSRHFQEAAYAAYYEKCQEYMALTGGTVGEERYYEDLRHEAVWCAGLNLVDLIDFNGDGFDELLLVYYDESIAPGPGSEPIDYQAWHDTYVVEVWEYRDGELVCIFAGPLSTSTNLGSVDGLRYFNWSEEEGGLPGLYFNQRSGRSEAISLLKYQYGELSPAISLEWGMDDAGNLVRYVNGNKVSESEYGLMSDEARDQSSNDSKTLVFNNRDTSYVEKESESDPWMSFTAIREKTAENVDLLRKEAGVTEG